MVRYTVYFTGRVQGVGFRYTTVNIARRFHVAGYVQNLPDGRVKLAMEGQQDEMDALIEDIFDAMGRHIRQHTIERGDATGEFGKPTAHDTFAVRY